MQIKQIKSSSIVVILFLLTSCSKAPSELACGVWEEKRASAGVIVDNWSKLSVARELTLDEKMQSWAAAKDYTDILHEMDIIGCKY